MSQDALRRAELIVGTIEGVARGDHPMRTPVYGAALIVAAMLGSVFVWQSGWAGWLRVSLLLVALLVALTGWLMTFRDLSRPIKRRRP